MEVSVDHPVSKTRQVTARSDDDSRVFFRCDDESLVAVPESILAPALVRCMFAGEPLSTDLPIDPEFSAGLEEIQTVFSTWYDYMTPVDVTGPLDDSPGDSEPTGRVGSFFTCGVDSMYTFFSNRERITDLIYVHGFDVLLSDEVQRESASRDVRAFAEQYGVNVIEIETNLRPWYGPMDWGRLCHGSALAAVAHTLSHALDEVLISSGHTYADSWRDGSHPFLDRNWSSSSLRIVHSGMEHARPGKTAFLCGIPGALQFLRVCYQENRIGPNCGRCEKCLRTMISLRAAGAPVSEFRSDVPFDLKAFRKLPLRRIMDAEHFTLDNLNALSNKSNDRKLYRALRRKYRAAVVRRSLGDIKRAFRR